MGVGFPAVLTHMSYRQSLELVREHAPVPGPEVQGVLGETLWRVLDGRGLPQ